MDIIYCITTKNNIKIYVRTIYTQCPNFHQDRLSFGVHQGQTSSHGILIYIDMNIKYVLGRFSKYIDAIPTSNISETII